MDQLEGNVLIRAGEPPRIRRRSLVCAHRRRSRHLPIECWSRQCCWIYQHPLGWRRKIAVEEGAIGHQQRMGPDNHKAKVYCRPNTLASTPWPLPQPTHAHHTRPKRKRSGISGMPIVASLKVVPSNTFSGSVGCASTADATCVRANEGAVPSVDVVVSRTAHHHQARGCCRYRCPVPGQSRSAPLLRRTANRLWHANQSPLKSAGPSRCRVGISLRAHCHAIAA